MRISIMRDIVRKIIWPYFIVAILLSSNVFLFANLQANKYSWTKVIYSQDQVISTQLIALVQSAQKYVYVAVYTLTRSDLTDALIAAKLRGLDVKAILDYNQTLIDQEKPQIKKLQKYGITLEMPFKPDGLMHMKMLVTDQGYASGSYNWTTSANSYNDEVIEIGSVSSIQQQYLNIFNSLFKKYSQPGGQAN
jgi:phosphatidylserine/phosphatidylglycerophosphate/cardiolipin synthase-like enzyme